MNRSFIQNLLAMAESGDSESQFMYAMMNLDGRGGIPKNTEQAFHWLKRASNNGHVEAQYRLGWLHWKGYESNRNHKEAIIWLEKAASCGHIDARNAILRLKAENGDSDAQYQLGLLYLDDQSRLGVSLIKSTQWIKKAAEQGHEDAQKMVLDKLNQSSQKNEVSAISSIDPRKTRGRKKILSIPKR